MERRTRKTTRVNDGSEVVSNVPRWQPRSWLTWRESRDCAKLNGDADISTEPPQPYLKLTGCKIPQPPYSAFLGVAVGVSWADSFLNKVFTFFERLPVLQFK
jgi:hypothetical protein